MRVFLEHVVESVLCGAEFMSGYGFLCDIHDVVFSEVFVIESNTAERANIDLTVDVDVEKTAAHVTNVALYYCHITIPFNRHIPIHIISDLKEKFTIFAVRDI